MTVTRDPAGRSDPAGSPDAPDGPDAELDALEAAAERARGDARKAAQAVRLARRAKAARAADSATAAAAPAEADTAVVDVPTPKRRVSIAKPASDVVAAPDVVEEAGDDLDDADLDDADLDDADLDDELDVTDDEDADDSDEDDAPGRRPRGVTVLATVFVVLAAVFVVVAFAHEHGRSTGTSSVPAARDAALLAARQDIVVLNTLDYTDVNGGLQRWLGATTGTLHDQLSQVSDADKQAIAVSKSTTTASVLAAAVTQVDPTHGSATVIATVQVDVTPATGSPSSKRNRFSLTMTRVGDLWKLSGVTQVAVTLT